MPDKEREREREREKRSRIILKCARLQSWSGKVACRIDRFSAKIQIQADANDGSTKSCCSIERCLNFGFELGRRSISKSANSHRSPFSLLDRRILPFSYVSLRSN